MAKFSSISFYVLLDASDPEKQETKNEALKKREGTKKSLDVGVCECVCVSVLILREGKLGDRELFFFNFGNNEKNEIQIC